MMETEFLQIALPWLMGGLGVCLGLLFVRFVLGPTQLDRLAAFEASTLVVLCFAALVGLQLRTVWFFDFILVLSLVGFLSTLAVAHYIEGDENDD
ncbi:MAG: cation:proton antiporter [Candidatus Omnitrophica bacterium]|nr:cation:proton antiporter [Candidatus Omnitrophota bacterium]MCA9427090.1 cation:proton antiporter [Candidatus Omnitrophota bacterium]MCA9439871.1 cation:proton antiporter [Candidatus Omnitrophota bacterium]